MPDYVPSTKNIWPYYSANNEGAAKTGANNSLGKDEFMKILVAQMQNQDPMQPMQDREYIAQMAQFTSVEQLMNLSTEMKKLANSLGFSASLIGKFISWEQLSDDGAMSIIRSGLVEGLSVLNGETYAAVNNELVAMSQIVAISNAPAEQPPDNEDGDEQPQGIEDGDEQSGGGETP